jgi:hypothetical protein
MKKIAQREAQRKARKPAFRLGRWQFHGFGILSEAAFQA